MASRKGPSAALGLTLKELTEVTKAQNPTEKPLQERQKRREVRLKPEEEGNWQRRKGVWPGGASRSGRSRRGSAGSVLPPAGPARRRSAAAASAPESGWVFQALGDSRSRTGSSSRTLSKGKGR